VSDNKGADDASGWLNNQFAAESDTPVADTPATDHAAGPLAPDDSDAPTQAMSLEEIAAVQADEVQADELSTQAMSVEEIAAVHSDEPDELSTQAMSIEEVAAVQADEPAELSTQAMTQQEIAHAEQPSARASEAIAAIARATALRNAGLPAEVNRNRFGAPTSPLDALFHDDQFREHQPAVAAPLFPPPVRVVNRAPFSSTHKTLLWVAGSLVAVLLLIAFFVVGTLMGTQSAENTLAEVPTPTASAPAPVGTGPQEPGRYDWDELRGGECLGEFESAFADTFTVVDCADAPVAQLVAIGDLTEGPTVMFPGDASLQADTTTICTAPTVLNYDVAGTVPDLVMNVSYPSSATEWDAGSREYLCFASRSSGEPLPGDIAAPLSAE